jgi:hypothetical protein
VKHARRRSPHCATSRRGCVRRERTASRRSADHATLLSWFAAARDDVQRNGVASIGIIARRSSLEPQDLAAARTGAVRCEHRTSASEQITPARGRQQLADQRPLCQWRDTTHLCRSSSRLANGGSASARSQGRTQAEDDPRKTPVGTGRHGTERDSGPRFCATGWASVVVRVLSSTASAVCYPWCAVALAPEARQCPAFATWSGGSWLGVRDGSRNRLVTAA